MIEFNDYSKSVKILADSKSDLIFRNSNHLHASVVLSNILRTSSSKVCIFDDNLSGDIADLTEQFKSEIKKFIKLGKRLEIVVKGRSEENDFQVFLKDIIDKFPEKLLIRLASSNFISAANSLFDRDINFATGDMNKFRLEYVNKNERKAYCSFNNLEYPQLLYPVFDKYFYSCENYF